MFFTSNQIHRVTTTSGVPAHATDFLHTSSMWRWGMQKEQSNCATLKMKRGLDQQIRIPSKSLPDRLRLKLKMCHRERSTPTLIALKIKNCSSKSTPKAASLMCLRELIIFFECWLVGNYRKSIWQFFVAVGYDIRPHVWTVPVSEPLSKEAFLHHRQHNFWAATKDKSPEFCNAQPLHGRMTSAAKGRKLCWLVPDDRGGGVVSVALSCCRQALEAGEDPTLLMMLSPTGHIAEHVNFRLTSLNVVAPGFDAPERMVQWLHKNPQDVVFLNGCEQADGMIPFVPAGVRSVYVVHDTVPALLAGGRRA